MNITDILHGWTTILSGRNPFISIEITRECPLTCPGCYAYGTDHLGGIASLRSVSDFQGQELVDRVIALIDEYRPLHVSLVGGEPLVRYRELGQIIPILEKRNIRTTLVTSAVRPIPREWNAVRGLTIAVSIDGLQPEHDARRKPATYDRILDNIAGHRIAVHSTVTSQVMRRPGYLEDFIAFWSSRPETEKIWMSLFTPQMGETSVEILSRETRSQVIRELLSLREVFPKLAMPKGMIEAYADPPSNPDNCIFARTTTTFTADLRTRVTPCQFGGTPDCSQCGCSASAGLNAIGGHRLPLGIRVSALYDASLKVGNIVTILRNFAGGA